MGMSGDTAISDFELEYENNPEFFVEDPRASRLLDARVIEAFPKYAESFDFKSIYDLVTSRVSWITRGFSPTYFKLKDNNKQVHKVAGELSAKEQADLYKYCIQNTKYRIGLVVHGVFTEPEIINDIFTKTFTGEGLSYAQRREMQIALIAQMLRKEPRDPNVVRQIRPHLQWAIKEFGSEALKWVFDVTKRDGSSSAHSRPIMANPNMQSVIGLLFTQVMPAEYARYIFDAKWHTSSPMQIWDILKSAHDKHQIRSISDLQKTFGETDIWEQAKFYLSGLEKLNTEGSQFQAVVDLVQSTIAINLADLSRKIFQTDQPIESRDVKALLAYFELATEHTELFVHAHGDFSPNFTTPEDFRIKLCEAIQGRIPLREEAKMFGLSHITLERFKESNDRELLSVVLVDHRDDLQTPVVQHYFSTEGIEATLSALSLRRKPSGVASGDISSISAGLNPKDYVSRAQEFGRISIVSSSDDPMFAGVPSAVDAVVGYAVFTGQAADAIAELAIECAQATQDKLANVPDSRRSTSRTFSKNFLERFVKAFELKEGPNIEHTDKAVVAYRSIMNAQVLVPSAETGISR